MQCRFIALFVLVLFVFSCDQDKPTAQVDSAPAHLDESLTTIEVNGAVFRRVAAKAVSTTQDGSDMSIVLNYRATSSTATIVRAIIDGITFYPSGCDERTEQGIVELVGDDAFVPSTDFENASPLEIKQIVEHGGAIWKMFGPYELEAGTEHYFSFLLGAKTSVEIKPLSDIGVTISELEWDGQVGHQDRIHRVSIGNVGDSATSYFKIQGDTDATSGTYTILVETIRNYDQRPPQEVGDTRSRARPLPFPTIFLDGVSVFYRTPPFYVTQGDKDYFLIDVPQRMQLHVTINPWEEPYITNPTIKLVRSNRRIVATSSERISEEIDAGQYWIKVEGSPPQGEQEGSYVLSIGGTLP